MGQVANIAQDAMPVALLGFLAIIIFYPVVQGIGRPFSGQNKISWAFRQSLQDSSTEGIVEMLRYRNGLIEHGQLRNFPEARKLDNHIIATSNIFNRRRRQRISREVDGIILSLSDNELEYIARQHGITDADIK